MSDDNKDLGDELNDMIGDAKESAKKAGEKISQKTNEFKEDAKEFANEAKEKASEFANDAKQVLSDGKNVAIIAHIHIIGLIIAFVMNNGENKTDYGSFYIKQMLGIVLLSLVWIVPVIGWILGFGVIILWVISLISALSGKKKPVPLLGEQFQEWFKNL